MFGRLMSKVFGIEKKTDESSSKERRHSFEDTSPRKHQTRSKGKKRSTPEAKRQRSEEPPLAFSNVKIEEGASKGNNSVDSSPDSEKSAWINVEIKPPSANLQESSTSEKDPTAVDTDKSDDYIKVTQSKTSGESASPECVVNPPSPDQPVLVDGPAMSASTWESVDTSTTKEHVYKDCVVIETKSEHKDRLSKEFQCLPDNSEGKVQLSTDSFIKIEEASEDMTSLNDKNWNNMNASAFLDIDMPTESESRRLTTSFVHIDQKDVFGLEESKNNAESEVRSAFGELGNLETVDELSISSSDKNSNAQDVITFGANSSKQQSEHDSMSTNDCSNTQEKNQSTEVHKTESMIENGKYNVDADAKYVVPKMPVSQGQGGNKLSKKLEKRERWKEKKRKSKTPEKSLTKKDTKSKEDAGAENSSSLQQENNEVSKEGEEKILASDVKTDSTNIEENEAETSSKRDEKVEEKKAEQTDVNTNKPKQKYVIPSKRNKGSISPSERPRKEKDQICASASETREEKKEEKYETEPKNFLEFVQRKTAKGVIVDAKKLMFELGFLKDVKQTAIHEAVIDQYKMAADRKFHYWIKQARYNAELIFTQDWIEENLPSLEGNREKKSDWRKKKQEKRKSGHSEYDRPAGGMCRDVRLETDPSLQVVRENIGSKSSIEKVAHVETSQKLTENTKKELDLKSDNKNDQRSSDSSRSSRMKYSDVRLETNPNMMVVRENAGSRSKDQKEKTDRSLRMKYSDVRLETNPNLMVVRENAGSKSKNQKEMTDRSLKMKYSDVRLETNPNLNVVRENAADKSRSSRLKYTDVRLESNPNLTTVRENAGGKTRMLAKESMKDIQTNEESQQITSSNITDAEVKAEQGENQNDNIDVMPAHDQIKNNSTDASKNSLEVSKIELESEKFTSEPENESAMKEGDNTERSQDQLICDKDLTPSKVETMLKYSEAVKSAGKCKETKTEKDDLIPDESDTDVKNEVSGALTSLLALVETEITKKFDDNGNPITDKQGETFSENVTKIYDHQGENHDREIKDRERMTEEKQTDMKEETMTIILEVDVKTEGEGFVVKTKLHESVKSDTGIYTETSDTLEYNKESKVTKEPVGQENDKQSYAAALGLVQSKETLPSLEQSGESLPLPTHSVTLDVTKMENQQKIEDENISCASDQKLKETEKLTSVNIQSESVEKSSSLTQNVITLVNEVCESSVQKQVETLAKEVQNEIPVEMPANGLEKIDEKDKTTDKKETIEKKSLPLTLTDSIFSLVQETRVENTQEKLESLVKGMAKTKETDEAGIITCEDTLTVQADYKMQSESKETKSDKVEDTKTKVAISKAADDTKASEGHTKSMIDKTNKTDENKVTSDVVKTIEGVRKTLMDITKTVEDDRITIEDITKKVTHETLKTAETIETDNVRTVQYEYKTMADVIESIEDVKNTLKDINKTVEDDTKTIADLTKTVQGDIEKEAANISIIDDTKIEGAESKTTTDDTRVTSENIESEIIQTDIKTIEKGLKDLITEMAAKEKISADDNGVQLDYRNSPTNSNEIGEQVRRLSPLGMAGSLSPTMVRSCEFLAKDGNLSEADSLENLSVKSDGGSRSNSKSQRKTVGSRIQQPKSYSRSHETPNKSSFKERNWHGTSTPGRYGNSRHDSCKQPVQGWYDHSYGSPRQYGQYHSYSESHDKNNRGRGSYGNTPRGSYRKQNYNTPDRFQQTNSSSYKSHSYKESHYVKEHNGKTTDRFTHDRKQGRSFDKHESDNHGSNYKSSDVRKSEMGGGIEKKIEREKDYITTSKPKNIDTKYKSSDSRQKIEKQEEHYSKLSEKVSGSKSVNQKEAQGSTGKKETSLPKCEDIPSKALESSQGSGDKMKCSSDQKPDLSEDTSKEATDSSKEGSHQQAQGTSKGATNSQKQKQKKKRRSNAKYKW